MNDDLSKIENKINLLKQKREKIKTQKALFLLKEAQGILSDSFSYELVLSILKYAWTSASDNWTSASDKQKEEWIKSAKQFRREGSKRSSKRMANSQKEVPQHTAANP